MAAAAARLMAVSCVCKRALVRTSEGTSTHSPKQQSAAVLVRPLTGCARRARHTAQRCTGPGLYDGPIIRARTHIVHNSHSAHAYIYININHVGAMSPALSLVPGLCLRYRPDCGYAFPRAGRERRRQRWQQWSLLCAGLRYSTAREHICCERQFGCCGQVRRSSLEVKHKFDRRRGWALATAER